MGSEGLDGGVVRVGDQSRGGGRPGAGGQVEVASCRVSLPRAVGDPQDRGIDRAPDVSPHAEVLGTGPWSSSVILVKASGPWT